jgi:arginine decarboxylase
LGDYITGMKNGTLERWTVENAAEMYGVRDWGAGYFDVSKEGEVLVRPRNGGSPVSISMMRIVADLKARGLGMPVLLRFGDILDSRVALLNDRFLKAIQANGYKGAFRGVYPIKVNQQQQVAEEITRFGSKYHHGLEAGSKAELIAAVAYMHDPEAFLVCNGYKDEEFIDLALHAQKMGLQTIIVIEMPGELGLVLERAVSLNVRPRIGVRLKLSTRAGGHWTESGGDRSVFGLNAAQVIDVVDTLRARYMLDCLQMLHYHLGSQIPNIRNIRAGVSEAVRFYVDLAREGAAMGILDIGGGLAVDYDGSHTNFACSSNYTIDEYCVDIIEQVMAGTDKAGIPHPTIISESGRATVAYYSVLLFNVLAVSRLESHGLPEKLPANAHELLANLLEINTILTTKNMQECYHDAVFYRDEVRSRFLHGDMLLRERATAEQIFWHIMARIAREMEDRKYVPDEFEGLESLLADVYYCNFSVFQSLPDTWAIQQLFPIMPIHRLNEPPTRKATLSDITCDCDGKIDKFIDLHDVKATLPLHPVKDEEDYYLGVFLVGAYQETLGDLHNLFGDTNVVSIRITDDGEILYDREIHGDTVADVLSVVEYDPKEMLDRVRRLAEQGVRSGRLTVQERRQIVEVYEAGLRGYTYFEQ